MLMICCVLVILAVGYAMHNEGLFQAVVMLVNVLLAGFLTYEFWEPLADALEAMFRGNFLAGLEDHLAMMLLFAVFLAILRAVTNSLAKTEVELNPNLHRYGGAAVGLLTGYLLAGFLVCAMETLPLSVDFMGFTPISDTKEEIRSYFPPDRVWTVIMNRAGTRALAWKKSDDGRYRTFDQNGIFELSYQRYRRYTEKDGKKETLPWQKEIKWE